MHIMIDRELTVGSFSIVFGSGKAPYVKRYAESLFKTFLFLGLSSVRSEDIYFEI